MEGSLNKRIMVLKFLGSNRWLVEPQCSIERLTRRRALVGMNKSNSNTKSKTLFEGKTIGASGSKKIRVFKNQLDTADFLIDGLTCRRAYGASSWLP
jgi:hypothetical protein